MTHSHIDSVGLPNLKASDQLFSERIRKGSLSFFFAASLLGKKARIAVFWLYSWCRYCDDRIDHAVAEYQSEALSILRQQTRAAYQGATIESADLAFVGIRNLCAHTEVPMYYFEELLNGMQMDIDQQRYQTLDDLLLYCYRVAGTVGLISCHILGIRTNAALACAESMGHAMQLTNICRDVFEDKKLGRVYLPAEFFEKRGIIATDINATFFDKQRRHVIVSVVEEVLAIAEHKYDQGMKGIKDLPLRAAFAVATARFVYGAIGTEVLKRGHRAWDERVWISFPRKLLCLSKAVLAVVATIPYRLKYALTPFQPITAVRRHP
jgi:phytoene synthase